LDVVGIVLFFTELSLSALRTFNITGKSSHHINKFVHTYQLARSTAKLALSNFEDWVAMACLTYIARSHVRVKHAGSCSHLAKMSMAYAPKLSISRGLARFQLTKVVCHLLRLPKLSPGFVASIKAINRAGKSFLRVSKNFPALFIAFVLAAFPGKREPTCSAVLSWNLSMNLLCSTT